jgi:diguanylate cyclase (GGDEF)-like protein
MYREEQYNRDLRFVEKIDKMASPRLEFLLYFCAFIACLIAHVCYLMLFAMAGAKIMVIFNIFSVAFYAVLIPLTWKTKDKNLLVYATIAEIIAHAVVATMCVGLLSNFAMFLLMLIPLAFLMPNTYKQAPFAVLFLNVPLYGILNYYYSNAAHVLYDIVGTSYQTIFYIINIIVGSFVLIYISIIFTIMNSYNECKLRMQTKQLKDMATTDPLTKLNNRRAMNLKLAEVSISSEKYVIGIGDIDNFKHVNDTYGHDMGDEVLKDVAKTIEETLPDNGTAGRWGGEEFIFVIPDRDITEGKVIADKILKNISDMVFEHEGKTFSVTMTIGICEGVKDTSIDNMITRADARLYKGKNSGKNHTEFAD